MVATRPHIFAVCLFVVFGGVAAAGGKVLYVDPTLPAGMGYSEIQWAVDAAADGDTILVAPGQYQSVFIANKSLALVGIDASGGQRPVVRAQIEVRGLAAARMVTVRGFRIEPSTSQGLVFHGMVLWMNAGSVVVEDVDVAESPAVLFMPGAGYVRDCQQAVFTRCTLHGARGSEALVGIGDAGAAGFRAENSRVFLYDCEVIGGDGFDASTGVFAIAPATRGGAGLELMGGEVTCVGTSIRGGSGGDGFFSGQCFPSADGGDAVVTTGLVRLVGAQVFPGMPGTDPLGCPQIGVAGEALVATGGTIQTIPVTPRTLEVPEWAAEGQPVTLTFHGIPGEPVWLFASATPAFVWLPGLSSTLLVTSPVVVPLGTVLGSGKLPVTVTVPNGTVPAGCAAIALFAQAAALPASGGTVLSNVSVLTLFD